MNWGQARRLLRLAGRRRLGMEGPQAPTRANEAPLAGVRAGSVCVASGKGGTGKSVVSASLAHLLAARGRTLIVDADLGVGNAHILQDTSPEHSFVDVVEGRLSVREVVAHCNGQLDLIAAGSGVSHMASLSSYELQMVASGIESLEQDYRHVVVDSAAGISHQTLAFAAACDVLLLVTTPDLTAMTDAYAFLKVVLQRRRDIEPLLVVNRARSFTEAEHVAERIVGVARKFLGFEPRWVATIPDDPKVQESVNHRKPLVEEDGACEAAQALRALAVTVLEELGRQRNGGVGRSLSRVVGYSRDLV